VRRNRRRYGGYLVHAGVAILFVGVAASSAFKDTRDARLAPGERTHVGAYDVRYVRPTADVHVAANGRLEAIALGADLRVRHGGRTRLLHTERRYFPSSDGRLGAVSRYFDGEATSEVGLDAGWGRDVWTAVAPDLGSLQPIIRRGDAVFAQARDLSVGERAAALGETLRRLTDRYRSAPSIGTLRVIVWPLVTWIWLGAALAVAGGLIAIWPVALPVRTRSRAASALRLRGRRARQSAA
jgi:cytochrome c-type biogenesis protein CcmF